MLFISFQTVYYVTIFRAIFHNDFFFTYLLSFALYRKDFPRFVLFHTSCTLSHRLLSVTIEWKRRRQRQRPNPVVSYRFLVKKKRDFRFVQSSHINQLSRPSTNLYEFIIHDIDVRTKIMEPKDCG